MSKNPLDHGDMVRNIVDTYQRATPAQIEAGTDWYPTARRIVGIIADASGVQPNRVCYALSALSPRNPWRWNVADAYAFAMARAEGRLMPSGATTFKRNAARAWQALAADGAPWLSAAPKVNAFVFAILGDLEAVVVDVWAYRVATTTTAKAIRPKAYAQVERAYREAAAKVGIAPRDLQAITWLVAQTEGLASLRKSRHDLTFKAGTPDIIKEALS